MEAFVQLGRKDDNFTRCDAWCQSLQFHALWMWFTLTHVILHHFHIFYPCIKTTVVNPQQKEWRQHVPDVFRCMEARSLCGHFRIHRRPQIPKVGWMICKRMELWSSKMSSARKRSRSAGAAAVVWVSILCQWNYCIIFHLIQCFVFWFRLKVVCLHTSSQILVKPSFGFPPFEGAQGFAVAMAGRRMMEGQGCWLRCWWFMIA